MDKRCSKCDTLQPENNYATYFHSTQNKFRTRNVCNTCFRLQKKLYKESIKKEKIIQPDPVEIVSTPIPTPTPEVIQPNTKKCNTCGIVKVIEKDFYRHGYKGYLSRCIECQLKIERKLADEKKKEQGGSMKVRVKPNQYADNYQRENTFELMTLLGYEFDEPTGIWVKFGYKWLVNGRPKFVFIESKKVQKPKLIKKVRTKGKITQEDIDIIIDLRSKHNTLWEIECKTGFSDTTIWNVLKKNNLLNKQLKAQQNDN